MATINPNIDITANTGVDIEDLLDKIADELIIDSAVNPSLVASNQKTIRNGLVQLGRNLNDKLLLYQKDIKANEEDLRQTTELDDGEVISDLQSIANQIVDFNTLNVGITEGIDNSVGISLIGGGLPGGGTDITNLIVGDGNPLNISQFVSIGNKRTVVNPNQAEEFLDYIQVNQSNYFPHLSLSGFENRVDLVEVKHLILEII